MTRPRSFLVASAPYLAFFLSGASSLIFESIWTRYLHHVFGSTSVAMSTVLSVFMAGLGLGAWIFGRYAERIKRPLVVYAVAELAVAVCGLIIPFLVRPDGWLGDLNAWLRATYGGHGAAFVIMRFLAVVPILIVPTTLMGSTLPLLARHFVQTQQAASAATSRVGVLYALNTAGAVAGTGLGGLVILPTLGLNVTNLFAASINLLLGLGILLLMLWATPKANRSAPPSKKASEEGSDESSESDEVVFGSTSRKKAGKGVKASPSPAQAVEPAPSVEPRIPPIARKLVLVVFAFSGATALCYEVVWTRALANVIGSSIHSFTLILMTFLIGIAGGSALAAGLLDGAKRPLLTVALCSGGLSVLAVATVGVAKWGGLGAYAFTLIVMWLLIGGLTWVSRAAVQRSEALDPDAAGRAVLPWGLAVLGVPVLGSLGLALSVEGTMSKIVASVVGALAAYLAVILVARRALVLMVALVQLMIAATTFVNYFWADEIPLTFARLVAPLKDSLPDHVGLVRFFMFITAGLCTLPATFGMGAMFPIALRLWTSGGQKIARDVGVVYTSNTLGSIVGAWLPGFVLMPAIGMEHTLLCGIAVNAVMALVMLVASAADTEPGKLTERGDEKPADLPMWQAVTVYVLAPLIPALLALGYLGSWSSSSPLHWNRAQMTLGVFRVSLASDVLDPEHWGEPDLVYYHDGLSTTVTVERWGRHLALKNNGKVDASNGDDMPTQIMVAGYPLLMHERGPTGLDVAIVGFGSGVTVGTTLQFPVRSVHVIELERSIPEASKWFEPVNHLRYPLDDFPYVQMPRLTVVNDDGRNYLASTHDTFDVIMSEPSNPWITGVSDLFTVDHFRIAKQRLRPGGIYCQWVQLYEMSPAHIKTIFRTFASQFRYVVVFAAEDLSSDTVVLGSDSPLPLDLERVRRTFQLSGVAGLMEGAYIHTPFDVFSRVILASRDDVMHYTQLDHERQNGHDVLVETRSNGREDTCSAPDCHRAGAPLNTDDNAIIEFGAPDDLIGFQRYSDYLENIYSPDWPYGRLMTHLAGFGTGDEAARNYAEQAMSLIASGRKNEAAQVLAASQHAGRARETAVALETLALLMSDDREPRIEIEPPVPGPQLDRRQAEQLVHGFDDVKRSVDEGAYESALQAMEEIPPPLRLHSGPALRFLYGYLLYKGAGGQISQYRAAIDQLEDLVRGDEDYVASHPEVYYFLARAYDSELSFDKSLRNMRSYVEARVVPATGPDDVLEPPLGQAPTTDDPGESPKEDDGRHHA